MSGSSLPLARNTTVQESKKIQVLRYISLASSFIVALSAGSNYGFSSYSPQLQERLHLTSTQINIVGVMGNMGVYLSGPIWGRLVDKRGLRIPLIASAVLVFVGYGGLSLSYRGFFSYDAPIVLLALFSLSTGLGNCAAFTASMNAQAKSWGEERRGLCTALVLSGFGLSAFFYSLLSHTLFPGKTGDYLLLLAFGSALSYLIGLSLIRILPQESSSTSSRVRAASHASSTGEHEAARPLGKPHYIRRRTSSDIGGRAWSYAVPDEQEVDETPSDSDAEEVAGSGRQQSRDEEERRGLLHESPDLQIEQDSGAGKKKKDKTSIDITGWRLVKNLDFIILFLIMTMVSGTGLLVINNIGTMTRTLYEYNKRHTNSLFELFTLDADAFKQGDVQQLQAHQVSAISVGNALGRIFIGLLSDLVVNRTGKSANRVYLLLLVSFLALASQGLAATPDTITDLKKLLTFSSTTGLMYGTLFGICPVLTFEWFGLGHFSQNWGIISLSPVIAGNIFNLLFGKIYDSHVPKDEGKSHTHLCLEGEECFRAVFKVTEIAAVIAMLLSIVIIVRRAGRPKWTMH